jgi:hypothetical protein
MRAARHARTAEEEGGDSRLTPGFAGHTFPAAPFFGEEAIHPASILRDGVGRRTVPAVD